jgi:hypothetical protein
VACKGPQKSTAKPTICAREHRTININATCGGDDDWYYYSPWRAPGAAPVFDSCGMAGGHKPPNGRFGGIYVNTSHAKLGDAGSQALPRAPSNTTWRAGMDYEVRLKTCRFRRSYGESINLLLAPIMPGDVDDRGKPRRRLPLPPGPGQRAAHRRGSCFRQTSRAHTMQRCTVGTG